MCWRRAGSGGDGWSADLSSFRGAEGVVGAYAGGGYVSNGGMAGTPSAPQGPGGPARAYRYRLALRRPYRYRYRRWVRVDGGRGVRRGLGWRGSGLGWEQATGPRIWSPFDARR